MFSTRTTPAWRIMESSASRGARELRTACPGGTPYPLTPDFTTTTGFLADSRRAIRENLRALPMLSRYRPTTAVLGSSSQYCMQSLPDTSARLPADTKLDTPRPRRAAEASTATPRAPDWLNRPRPPTSGRCAARDALRRTCGLVLSRPIELGPTIRMPCVRATRTS